MIKEVLVCVGAAVAALAFGYALGFSSPALPAMLGDVFHEVKCTNHEQSSVMSSLWSSLINIGAMAGALRAGQWLEYFGRRGSLLYIVAPCAIIGWLWTFLAHDIPQLLASRFSVGVGLGATSSVVPVYIAESAPAHLRGALGALTQLAVTFGNLFIYFLGFILPHTSRTYNCGDHVQSISPSGWRLLALVGALLGAFVLLVSYFLPETPIFLTNKYQLLLDDTHSHDSSSDQRRYTSIREIMHLLVYPKKDIACAKAVRLTLSFMAIQQCVGVNAVVFYASDILGTAGVKDRGLGGVVIMATQFVVTAISCFFIDRIGRVPLLSISLATMTSANALMAFYFAFNLPSIIAIFALILYLSGCSVGIGPITPLLVGELLPTRARNFASSLAALSSWSCSFIITEAFSTVFLPYLKPSGTFIFFASVSAYAFYYVQSSLPETKGLSFKAIEDTLRESCNNRRPFRIFSQNPTPSSDNEQLLLP